VAAVLALLAALLTLTWRTLQRDALLVPVPIHRSNPVPPG
jgi:hypothetical protein